MLYLYHGRTSVCSVKARLALYEKGLEFDGETLDLQRGDQHRPDYARLNPNHVVPTLVHDGRVIIESTLICEYLDEAFATPPLMPADPYQRAVARLWMKKIDDWLHPACSTITFAIAFRPMLLKKSKEELEARFRAMPDPAYAERQRLSIEQGLDAPHVKPALRRHDQYVGEMEETLGRSPYLAGEAYSLADLAATPYVYRAQALGLERLWSGTRPRVEAWWDKIRARPSTAQAIAGWETDADRQRYKAGGEGIWAKVQSLLAA
jgi:glutathione S-transferase